MLGDLADAIDDLDRKIIEYLMNYKSATTPELAEYLKTNRWLVLNRLQKIEKNSKDEIRIIREQNLRREFPHLTDADSPVLLCETRLSVKWMPHRVRHDTTGGVRHGLSLTGRT